MPLKTSTIMQAPNTLIIQLKRWKWHEQTQIAEVTAHGVLPTERLSLGNHTYVLRAVVSHEGDASPHAGHYVAIIQRHDAWWICDDAVTELASPQEVRTGCRRERGGRAYIVVYDKV